MANIKTPDGGFYLNDAEFDVDYVNNIVTLVGGVPTPTGNYLSLDGGTMNADAIISGTDTLEISLGDTTESSVVGVTQSGVTIEHNTNSEADSSIRVIENTVEINANDTSVVLNGAGVDFNADGKTVTLTNANVTDAILGQYYGYNG